MSKPARTQGRFAGLLLCCGAFVFLLAVQGWRLATDFYYVFAADKTRGLAMRSLEAGGPLMQAVLGYVGALLALHILAGAACWLVARGAETAFALDPARRRIRAVFAALIGILWLFLANAWWFPHSVFARSFAELARFEVGPWPVFALFSWLTVAGIAVIVVRALLVARPLLAHVRRRPAATVTLGVLLAVAALAGSYQSAFVANADAPRRVDGRPNVIFIGIDSLRCNLDGLGMPETLTPHVDAFLQGSHRFTDAITPLARTFPSWVSILTGRHPVTTGARINLTAREDVNEGETLPEIFAAAGYSTVMATDEVRFSNIDESYGYQQMIAPRIGGSDFLIGTVNDLPFANLSTLLPIGRHIFPDVYGNRAAFKTYRPETFVDMIGDQLVPDSRPTFLAVHLTLAHWPYAWATSANLPSRESIRPDYAAAVRMVDEQYASVMAQLKRKGLLENAIVIVLSDHGEGVGLPNDTVIPQSLQDHARRFTSMFGHGTSVLGPHQYRVVLGMRSFGNEMLPAQGAQYADPVTLEDVAPTLVELTGQEASGPFDGRSLVGLIRGEPNAATQLAQRYRFTESEYKPSATPTDEQSAKKIAMDAADIYRLEAHTGRFVVTDEAREDIVFSKELAVLQGPRKLAAVRDTDRVRKFYYFDGNSQFPRVTRDRDQLTSDPAAAPLLAALERRFPGEVGLR